MKTTIKSILVKSGVHALLLYMVATAVTVFLSACSTPAQRHDARVDARVEQRVDRRYDRRGWN